MKTNLTNKILALLFVFTFILSTFVSSNYLFTTTSYAAELPDDRLFSTKYQTPTSQDTSVVYTEFATRVQNKGNISRAEIYYVLTEDSYLTCHIMDENLNIIASSDSIWTPCGSGIQTFTIPDYTYDSENMYIALEADKQSIGLGTVQEISAMNDVVTSNNTIDGIQNAQKWSIDDTLRKHNGSSQYGISLYINAYGTSYTSESSVYSNENEINSIDTVYTKTPVNSSSASLLYCTKYKYPTNISTKTSYAGFGTRVTNMGSISYLEIYYVLSEDSSLYSRLLDTNLKEITRSSTVSTKKGVGVQRFTFPAYNYSGSEIYISLESNKQNLCLGTVQDNAYINSCVTANNAVSGLENAVCYSAGGALKKRSGSARTFSLYINVYGNRTDISVSSETKKAYNTSATANVYISSSEGTDKPTSGSISTPYKSITYAIKQHGDNTVYSLKQGDTFYFRYGLSLTNLKNVVINSYGTSGKAPSICGLTSAKAESHQNNIYTFSIPEKEIGCLILNGSPLWKRQTNSKTLTQNNRYYFDKSTKKLTLYSTSAIDTIHYAPPYTGILVSNCQNLTIDNLSVSFYGRLGIRVGDNCSNVNISNNIVHDIGGVVLDNNVRYGNGIELWLSNINDITVYKNSVYNCFDAGITAQVSGGTYTNTNITFSNNTVSNCRYNFEYFNSSSSSSLCQIIVSNNIFNNSVDITNGYREKANTSYGGFLCLWNSNGINDSVLIENNICTNSDANCVAIRDDNYGRIQINGNSFSKYKNAVVNPKYLHGSNNIF